MLNKAGTLWVVLLSFVAAVAVAVAVAEPMSPEVMKVTLEQAAGQVGAGPGYHPGTTAAAAAAYDEPDPGALIQTVASVGQA